MVEVKAKGTKPALIGMIVEREVTLDKMIASLRGALLATERPSVEMTIRNNDGWELVEVKVVITSLDHDVVGIDSWNYQAVVVECQDRPELIGLRVDGDVNFHNPLKVSNWMGLFTCYEAWTGSSV
jgi:hypothetical protein